MAEETLKVKIRSSGPESKWDWSKNKSITTNRFLLEIVGGGEDCPEEQGAYIPVNKEIGARVARLLSENNNSLSASLIIDIGEEPLTNMSFCPDCGGEIVGEECPACGWYLGLEKEIDS